MSNARRFLTAVAVSLLILAVGCSSGGNCDQPSTVAVLAAMPSELAPLLERATIADTQTIAGRVFRAGTLGGVHVVIAMTGIGLGNATETSRLLLDHFAIDGMVFSGVAGSPHRIADVTVPLGWSLPGGQSIAADPAWLDLARAAAGSGVVFDRCTNVPPDDPSADLVCMPFEPAIFVGGRGESSDPYKGQHVGCTPGGNDVFGCDPAIAASATAAAGTRSVGGAQVAADDDEDVTVDMETAAVAGEAAARGLRFIALRAVSDGAEDPLGLPGFPTQFFAYYRLAARNAAIATEAFLEQLSAASDVCS